MVRFLSFRKRNSTIKERASSRNVVITGSRGIPAQHGGFETFAQKLALHLKERGWTVTVACQVEPPIQGSFDEWNGIRRMLISANSGGALGTVQFDWKATLRSLRNDSIILVLGYNTAVFSLLYKIFGIPNVINMDGIEWKRAKWNAWQKAWLYFNERAAELVSTRLIADHPEIRNHLSRGVFGRKDIVVIPYGADPVPENTRDAAATILQKLALKIFQYVLVVARPEPENQILEIVNAFSNRQRGTSLVVLGTFEPNINEYHRAIMSSASDEVVFPGAIYNQNIVGALRANALLYIHGHTVGGTNPSLVEALAAASPVLADDNKFNRWVAGDTAEYFTDERDCCRKLDQLLVNKPKLDEMRRGSYERYKEAFTWENVLSRYESLLSQTLATRRRSREDKRPR